MAKDTKKSGGVAIGKRAKIDKAQSIMLAVVCGASLVFGVTVVGVINLAKLISYYGDLLHFEREAAKSYQEVQNNLESIRDGVQELSTNEALESVARNTKREVSCQRFDPSASVEDESYDINLTKSCSALRVISDVIPVDSGDGKTNVPYASHASFMQLLNWSGVMYDGLSATEATQIFEDKIHTVGYGLTAEGESEKIKGMLELIESSIRNFDLQSASIRFGSYEQTEGGVVVPTIEFSGIYGTYYADRVGIDVHTETLCANKKNKKCPGDTLSDGDASSSKEGEASDEGK